MATALLNWILAIYIVYTFIKFLGLFFGGDEARIHALRAVHRDSRVISMFDDIGLAGRRILHPRAETVTQRITSHAQIDLRPNYSVAANV